jgi:hypothetical protein
VDDCPSELEDLSPIEAQLVALAHYHGSIMRLQKRAHTSFSALKGHIVLAPQETREIQTILPMLPAHLTEFMRVVWVGGRLPSKASLDKYFTIRQDHVLRAMDWLMENHEDYKNVSYDRSRFSRYPPIFIAEDLLKEMQTMPASAAGEEDSTRSGVAVEDMDEEAIEGDLPITTSAIIDCNNNMVSDQLRVLTGLETVVEAGPDGTSQIQIDKEHVSQPVDLNVLPGDPLLNQWRDPFFFTGAFPTMFPRGLGKHLDGRRSPSLSFKDWSRLMVLNSSR